MDSPANAAARPPLAGYLFIAGAALCWGFTAAFARWLFTLRADPLTLAQVRASISFLLLLLLALTARRAMLRVSGRDAAGLALLGIGGIAASNYTYLAAIQRTNVTTAILVQYTAPAWVMLYAALVLREQVGRRRAFALALSFAGCVLAVGGYRAGGLAWDPAGIAFALGAAITFAFFNLWGARMARRVELWTSLLWSLGAATLFWALVRSPHHLASAGYPARQWAMLFLYAVLSILAPFALYYAGLKRLPASHTIVTSTLEPVFAILFAFLMVGERLSAVQLAGMLMVMAAVVILAHRPDSR